MKMEKFQKDEVVFKISICFKIQIITINLKLDSIGDKFYIILKGKVGVRIPKVPGDFSVLF